MKTKKEKLPGEIMLVCSGSASYRESGGFIVLSGKNFDTVLRSDSGRPDLNSTINDSGIGKDGKLYFVLYKGKVLKNRGRGVCINLRIPDKMSDFDQMTIYRYSGREASVGGLDLLSLYRKWEMKENVKPKSELRFAGLEDIVDWIANNNSLIAEIIPQVTMEVLSDEWNDPNKCLEAYIENNGHRLIRNLYRVDGEADINLDLEKNWDIVAAGLFIASKIKQEKKVSKKATPTRKKFDNSY